MGRPASGFILVQKVSLGVIHILQTGSLFVADTELLSLSLSVTHTLQTGSLICS